MPLKSVIAPIQVGNRYRVIVPKDLRGRESARTKWFPSKSKADAFCENLMNVRGEFGSRLILLGKLDQSRVVDALELAGDAQAILDAVRFWREQKPQDVATLKELAVRCVAAKERRTKGGESKYTKNLKRNLERLILGFEDKLAHSIQPHHIAEWISANPLWSQDTKQTYLRDLTTMFSYGVANGLVTKNPCEKVDRPAADEKPPFIWSPADAERFMRAAEKTDRALVQFCALCLFGGLRCDFRSEAWNVQKDDIRENEIAVQGKKVRSRNRRFVTINPTLRVWLAKYPGHFSPANMRRRLMAIRKATAADGVTEIEWNQNPMRHTFVSNYAAMHGIKDAAKEAGHDEETLERRYRERVTRADAERFWGILPKVISSFD